MSLIRKLAHEALSTHAGVEANARAQLDKELRPVAAAAYGYRVVPVDRLVDSSEAMSESLKSLVGTGKLRVDRVLYAQVPTAQGMLEVAVPFSGKDTMAPQFSLRLSVRAPAGATLERSVMGSWGFGNWVPSLGFSGSPAAQALCEKLEEANVSEGVEWNCQLPGDYHYKLPWTLQLLPSGPGQSRLLMQSGRVGILFTRFGVDVFMRKVQQAQAVLAQLAHLPEAGPGEVEECWADRVNEQLRVDPTLGLGSPPGASPGSPSAAFQGHRAASPADEVQRLRNRATVSLVLSAVAVPMCCAPLGLVGGGLALHARSQAKKAGVEAPGTTVAAIILSALSAILMVGVIIAGMVAPKDAKHTRPPDVAEAAVDAQGDEDDAAARHLQPRLDGDESPRAGFRITQVHERREPSGTAPYHQPGGDWTFFEAELEDDESCAFTVGVSPSQGKGPFGFGKLELSVQDAEAVDCLAEVLADAFAVDYPPAHVGPVGGPLKVSTAVLGTGVARSRGGGFSGKGRWTATKLFFERGDEYAEVFFNYDLQGGRGEFSQKDSEYDQALVNLVAAGFKGKTSAAVRPAKKPSSKRPVKR